MTSLHSKVFSGAVLMVMLRLMVKSIGLINTIILARLLAPEDFGLIALAMSVFAFLELINSFSFDVALIQNQNATKAHYDTAWTLKLCFGLLAGTLMVIAAHPLAGFYEDERLVSLCYCLALMFVVNGAVNIGVVNFRKELDFKTEFLFQILIKILTVSLTIYLAFTLQNYWALAIGMVANATFEFILSYIMSKFRPWFSLEKVKEIFGFSFWLVLNNALMYLNLRVKDLIIGKYTDIKFVGLYSVGDEIASLPTTEFVAAINRATFPGYSKVSHKIQALRDLYVNVLSSITLIGIPASIGIALVAPLFIPVVLGDQWLLAIPIMQILAVANAIISINTNAGYVFIALGKPRYSTLLLSIRVGILLTLMFTLIELFGYIGAAYAVLITSIVMFPVYFMILSRFIELAPSDYIKAIVRPTLSSLIMYIGGSYLIYNGLYLPGTAPAQVEANLPNLLLAIGIGGVLFSVSLCALWVCAGKPPGPEQKVIEHISKKLLKRKATD
ncbi:MAG: lipopolysaccharide biosynthesis protein [Pseudomonadales bacterium]|nr:lipopolysaccharide biosynthesis protein [Pseudomonadales bacterium]